MAFSAGILGPEVKKREYYTLSSFTIQKKKTALSLQHQMGVTSYLEQLYNSRTCIKRYRIKRLPSIKRSVVKSRKLLPLITVVLTSVSRGHPLLGPNPRKRVLPYVGYIRVCTTSEYKTFEPFWSEINVYYFDTIT